MKQYNTSFKLWWHYSTNMTISLYELSVEQILEFLQQQVDRGQTFGSINSHKSALAFIIGNKFQKDPRVKRFLKGVEKKKPPRPRYDSTWDPSQVITCYKSLPENQNLQLKVMGGKTVILLLLATGHRIQTIASIKLSDIVKTEKGLQIFISDRLKTSGKGQHQPCLQIPYLTDDPSICVAKALECYIMKTESLRPVNEDKLLITHRRPHKRATKQTIARWVKNALSAADINTNVFGPHSTRHAATSKAFLKNVNIETILRTAQDSDVNLISFIIEQ